MATIWRAFPSRYVNARSRAGSEAAYDLEHVAVGPGQVHRVADMRVVGPLDAAHPLEAQRWAGPPPAVQGQGTGEAHAFVRGLAERVERGRTLPEALVIALLEAHVALVAKGAEVARTDEQVLGVPGADRQQDVLLDGARKPEDAPAQAGQAEGSVEIH